MEIDRYTKEDPKNARAKFPGRGALTGIFKQSLFKRTFAFILPLVLLLFGAQAAAMKLTVPALLTPKMNNSKTLELGTATFHQSSGTATTIQKVSLTYFTSTNCSSGPFIPAFSTPDNSPPLTIPSSGNVSLNAGSTYNVAINGTPGTTSSVNSILVGLGNINGTFATFTGSCASTGGNCCLPITCDTGSQTCTASVGVQDFILDTAAPSATISTSSPLLIQPNTTGSLIITNTGPATATNIVATLPSSLSEITQNSSNCASVASGASCQLSFTTSSTLHDPTLISINGQNTNTVFATLSVALPWVTNGTVSAMVQDTVRHLIYIGGNFTQVGPNTGNGVPIDVNTAGPSTPFPKVNGTIKAVIPDGNNGWYIGGTFTNVGGVTRNNIAHIKNDGTVNSTWDPNIGSTVNALALSPDGAIVYAGGNFSFVNGSIPRNRIAAFNGATGGDTGTVNTNWNPNVGATGSSVNALALSPDGTIVYAGGSFITVNGATTRNRIAAFNNATTGNTGAVNTNWDPNISSTVNALALSPDGTIVYAGGAFTSVNGPTIRNHIAAFNNAATGNTGAVNTNWDPNISSTVSALALSPDGTIVYAGGSFTTVNGATTRNRIAAFNNAAGTNTGAVNTNWDPNVSTASSAVNALALSPDGTIVYAGGSFTTVNGATTRNRIAAFNSTTASNPGIATTFNPNANNTVNTLAINSSTLYAGGNLTSLGGQTRNRIAALNESDGTVNTNWNPNAGPTGSTVNALALSPDGTIVYAGGSFTTVNGATTRNRIAAFNNAATGNTGAVNTTWDPNISSTVNALALSPDGTIVYAGGAFTNVNGPTTRNHIAAFNNAATGNTGAVNTNWDPNVGSTVSALALSPDGTIVYAGGSFITVNGTTTPRNRIAAFNNATGTNTGTANTTWNPNVNNIVNALALSPDGTIVYAGGSFTSVSGGTIRNHIAAFNNAATGNTGAVNTTWDPNIGSTVNALALSPDGTIVYAGGAFITANGATTRNHIAAFNNAATGKTGAVTAFDPNANSTVNALVINGSTVYTAGSFNTIGNLPSSNFSIITQ